MTYSEAIDSLLDLTLFGSKLGLDNPRRLAALAVLIILSAVVLVLVKGGEARRPASD